MYPPLLSKADCQMRNGNNQRTIIKNGFPKHFRGSRSYYNDILSRCNNIQDYNKRQRNATDYPVAEIRTLKTVVFFVFIKTFSHMDTSRISLSVTDSHTEPRARRYNCLRYDLCLLCCRSQGSSCTLTRDRCLRSDRPRSRQRDTMFRPP